MDASAELTLFNDWTIAKLREFLRENNQIISGSKKELVERARGVIILKLTAVQGQNNQSEKNSKSSTFPDGEPIPDIRTLSNWSSDFTNIPDFSEKDIYNYLVIKMNTKRQLKSKVFLEDKHVHSVEYNPINNESSHCAIRCKVIPSFPSADMSKRPDYDVSTFLSKVTGNVFAAHCTCTAGYVNCNCVHYRARSMYTFPFSLYISLKQDIFKRVFVVIFCQILKKFLLVKVNSICTL